MRKPVLAGIIALAALALAGCGSSGPKRTVDARAEALRFFAAGTPLVALLATGPDSAASRAELGAAVATVPAWAGIRDGVLARLAAAGISISRLERLAAAEAESSTEGLPTSQLAVGLEPAPSGYRPLVVLVTSEPGRMDRLFARSLAGGHLRRAGEEDEARIYAGSGGAFAVRDGVMLAGAGTAQLRRAIDLRDGERGAQLDDGEVKSLLGKLPPGAPVEVYADMPVLRLHEPAVAALAQSQPWSRRLGKTVASLEQRPPAPVLDLFSEIGPGEAGGAVITGEDSKAGFAISVPETRRALSGAATRSSPLSQLSVSAAPLAVTVTLTGDELRAKLVLSP